MQELDLGAHLDAQLRVEVRQRLVEQEQRRVARERAAHRDALPLAARELARLALEQVLDLQHRGDAIDDLLLLVLRHLADVQPERDVLAHRHRRIERVRLEHHRDVAILRRQIVDDLIADPDLALRHGLEARDHVEQRRLPAARAADENQELTVLDVDVDALQDGHAVRVGLVHVTDGKACHAVNPLSHCGARAPRRVSYRCAARGARVRVVRADVIP
ncbi:hypothetical protein DO70_6442 [Burkholderia pseudomallei]|nr:hypothetical protein DO70_6442 [Burkholderia pseudomallei]